MSDHPEVSAILALILGMVVPNVLLGEGERALISFGIGALLLGLYLGIDHRFNRRNQ
jgi:hypothetical protein